jgi:type II secretory pathway pseudopilin PulG
MRRRDLRSQITNHKSQIRQRGYMMITLMLALALITIACSPSCPSIKQQIMRDREEEMSHRGTAYMRAIQHFYKKFGRYPTRVEELENTNNLRFLRKRYTDPINIDPGTRKERPFKFLHSGGHQLEQWTGIRANDGPERVSAGQVDCQDKAHSVHRRFGRAGKVAWAASERNPVALNRRARPRSTSASSDSGELFFQTALPPAVPPPAIHRIQEGLRQARDRRLPVQQPQRADIRRRPDTRGRQHQQSQDAFACSTTRTITTTGSSFTCN